MSVNISSASGLSTTDKPDNYSFTSHVELYNAHIVNMPVADYRRDFIHRIM